ncbi:1179_t:CDS:10 [Diversispora eburnea]|uniref:DNA mismatch repair protein MSH3 n=1 Tax=Diversispora eburnea TaxID=1213867 RepID=A0A9N9C551_9GLOM|nr:1179_t:CDS:10 [Diversispora eburnea]
MSSQYLTDSSSIYRSIPTTSNDNQNSRSITTNPPNFSRDKKSISSSTIINSSLSPSKSSLPTRRPRTSASTRVGRGGESHSFVVAVIEGRGGIASEVGMCFIDLRTSESILSQKISDSKTYVKTLHKMNIYDPVEILLSVTSVEPSKSKLCKILEDSMPFATIVPIGRKYFNDAIDCVTARNLELICNINSPHSNQSLYGVLNKTSTSMGARLLRTNILQPLNDAVTINTRLDSVEALKPFQDIDHLITTLIQVPRKPTIKHSEQSINNIIILKHTLKLIQILKDSLARCQNSLIVAIRELLSDSRLITFEDLINEVINKDITYQKSSLGLRNQRCYAVKLDKHTKKQLTIFTKLSRIITVNQYEIPLKIQFSPSTGFYLSTSTDVLNEHQLPLIFINVCKKKKMLTFTTLELNTKINDSLTEVYLMSDKTIEDLISEIRCNIGVLYKVSEAISMLDMLTSFAHQCTISNYVRPEFTDTLAIKNGRHPMRECLYNDPFIPNDTYANNATNFQLITGPNMSGKSTYLRQIVLISIMSQIGSFVPAEYASFRMTNQIFTRICNDDNIETNSSTFIVEMRETSYILQNITNNSLVIIDELGRGTSTHDGLGITYAVCEELLKTKLTRYLTVYPNVVNLHLEVEIENQSAMKYLYRVKDGSNDDEHYGLRVGKMIGLPNDIIEIASKISYKLKNLIDTNKAKSVSNKMIQRRKVLLQQTEQSTSISPPATNVINLIDFRNPQIPNTDGLAKSVELVFENFKKFSNYKKKENKENNHHIEKILQHAHEFNILVQESVQHCKQVTTYSKIFVEYLQAMTEEDVTGSDFIEVMKSQIQSAMKNKSDIENVTQGFSEILTMLVNLVWDLEDHTNQTNIEQLLSDDVNRARKEQKTREFAAWGTGITTGVAICAAPFTAGASLAIIGALGLASTVVTKELSKIIDEYNGFIEIFKSAIEDITKITSKYSTDAENVNFRMTRIKYLSMKNQWARVNEVFETYKDDLQRILMQ